jgi:hypothetical protein
MADLIEGRPGSKMRLVSDEMISSRPVEAGIRVAAACPGTPAMQTT